MTRIIIEGSDISGAEVAWRGEPNRFYATRPRQETAARAENRGLSRLLHR